MQDTSFQIRANASASYFFLAPLFLLARFFPQSQRSIKDPFVIRHAKSALLLQAGMLGVYIAFSWFHLGQSWYILNLPWSLGRILETASYLVLTAGIFLGVISAHQGKLPKTLIALESRAKNEIVGQIQQESATLSEQQKMNILFSYLPLFGFFIAQNHPSRATLAGARLSGIFFVILVLSWGVFQMDALISLLVFVYVLWVSFIGVQMFVFDKIFSIRWVENLFTLEQCGLYARTSLDWIVASFLSSLGKKQEKNWKDLYNARLDRESSHDAVNNLRPAYTGKFAPWVAYVPVFNIGVLFVTRSTRQFFLFLQGSLLSGIFLILALFSSPLLPLVLPLFCIGAASARRNPVYRMVLVFEFSLLIQSLLARSKKTAKTIAQLHNTEEKLSLSLEQGLSSEKK